MGLLSDAPQSSISTWAKGGKTNNGSQKRNLVRLPDGQLVEIMPDGNFRVVEG